MSGTVRVTRLDPPAVPYVEIVLPIEGAASAMIRSCKGNTELALHVIAQLQLDTDAAGLISAAGRLRDRQAA